MDMNSYRTAKKNVRGIVIDTRATARVPTQPPSTPAPTMTTTRDPESFIVGAGVDEGMGGDPCGRPPAFLCLAISIIAIFSLFLTACNNNNSSVVIPPSTPTSSSAGSSNPTPVASAPRGILLGPQPCPNAVKDPAHWDAIIPTQPNVSKVEGVTCGFLTGTPTLQALITVRYNDTGKTLDVYVYNNIESASPNQIFKLLSLYDGSATISQRNTVMTGEVDQNSSVNKGKDNASFTRDLFREFNTASFAPVSFPGIFPDITRYQAELDQAQVNSGQDSWKLSAQQVAAHFAIDPALLNWSNVNASLTSGGGSGDAEAVVTISNTSPSSQTVTLTMQRLEGNTNGGIWEIVSVASSSNTSLSITAPSSRNILTSPATVSGTAPTQAGITSSIVILDHTYSGIGHATAQGATFSAAVPYVSTFKTGMQDGIVALFATNTADHTIVAAVMIKELL